jgi:NAD(P)-dependent dehydrogenase (short-subunit alcohol dehydrogenase family)
MDDSGVVESKQRCGTRWERGERMPGAVDLGNRCALVTGAARGIGKAIALALGEAGADVAVAIPVRADVSDATAVRGMIVTVEREVGPVDVLVNNAGVALHPASTI